MHNTEPERRAAAHTIQWSIWSVALLLSLAFAASLGACARAGTLTPTAGQLLVEPTLSPAPKPRPSSSFSEIRPAAVAGSFYPDAEIEARAMLDAFLSSVDRVDGSPVALIVPHAGWVYSGQVAAAAYRQIEGIAYDTAIIIGPNHTDPMFSDISVYAEGAFETPLGLVAIDEQLAAELLAANERIVFDREVHEQEHSIEIQLPFLQRVCPDCDVVPILLGQPTPENLDILTQALVDASRGKRVLIIASSDLSHYPGYEDAVQVDTRSLAAIETMDDDLVSQVMTAQMGQDVPGLVTCACGEGPIVVAMRVARALGADHARVLYYANSGNTSGDHSRVVGYAAVMFWQWQPPQLSLAQQAELLSIARHALEQNVSGSNTTAGATTPEVQPPTDPVLSRHLGAFVTLELDGELRGCIGHMQGDTPLYLTVARAAVDAAENDPRFPPLPADQVDQVSIELSILSPFKRVRDVDDEAEIQVGRDGLYLIYGERRGVLLPQVPVEEGWDRAQYLEQICFKAGLSAGCSRQATVYTFTAQVFGDNP